VLAHGFLYVGGERMSKSRGTGIHPFGLLDRFGPDSYRYYFMREIPFGQDGNYSQDSMVDRHNEDLANGLGNLASRVLAMLASNYGGVVPDANEPAEAGALPALVTDVVARSDSAMEDLALTTALATVWEIVTEANRYLVERTPWKLAKDPDRAEELAKVLYASTEVLRILAVLISPVMPGAARRLWDQLGILEPLEAQRLPAAGAWGGLAPGTKTTKGESLFPRLDA
jgi:methionyl-tRNA synthetase